MKASEDPNHPGNSEEYHTGGTCIEDGCFRPAGTAWGKFWCFPCNVKRMKRVEGELKSIIEDLEREAETVREAADE